MVLSKPRTCPIFHPCFKHQLIYWLYVLLNYFCPAVSRVPVAFPLANPETLSLGNQHKITAVAMVESVSLLLAHWLVSPVH